jgi:hypothetical protein
MRNCEFPAIAPLMHRVKGSQLMRNNENLTLLYLYYKDDCFFKIG